MENEDRVEYTGMQLDANMPGKSFHTFKLFMHPFSQAQATFMIDMDNEAFDSTNHTIGMAHMRLSNLLKDYAEQAISGAMAYLARGPKE